MPLTLIDHDDWIGEDEANARLRLDLLEELVGISCEDILLEGRVSRFVLSKVMLEDPHPVGILLCVGILHAIDTWREDSIPRLPWLGLIREGCGKHPRRLVIAKGEG